jgi:hypothetical protein
LIEVFAERHEDVVRMLGLTWKRPSTGAALFHSRDRRYLPVIVPNFDIVSIKILFGGLDCGSVIRAVQ